MRRYLLDTCAMGDLINRRKGVHERARAARLGGARLGTCIPVLGELFFGIEFSQTRDDNCARLIRAIMVERSDTTGELGTCPGPEFLGHTTPSTRPPPAGELALQKPLAQRLSRRYDHQR